MDDIIGIDDLPKKETWQAAAAEFVATFAFVFLGPAAVVASFMAFDEPGLTPSRLLIIALGHGFAIAVLVWATGHISGGHINPAVTIAAFVTRKISLLKGSFYVIAQVSGAICGAFLLKAVIPDNLEGGLGAHALGNVDEAAIGFLVEVILTFFLVFVIFATAMDKRGPGNVAPFAIGMTVMLDHFIGVPLTGASMNPARTLGPAWAAGQWADHWLYWAGPIAGGIIAAVVYEAIFAKRGAEEEAA